MAEPLKVEVPDEDLAGALMRRLRDFPTELTRADERIEVTIALIGNADRAIVQVLDEVDEWLVENDLQSVRVHLDERTYTLTPPARTSGR
jgi:hypothetical protein